MPQAFWNRYNVRTFHNRGTWWASNEVWKRFWNMLQNAHCILFILHHIHSCGQRAMRMLRALKDLRISSWWRDWNTFSTFEDKSIVCVILFLLKGGLAITDEMCVNYVHYYPRVDLEVCKSSVDTSTLQSFFKFMNKWVCTYYHSPFPYCAWYHHEYALSRLDQHK